MLRIHEAAAEQDYALARKLIEEYAAIIGHDLEFQHIADELADPRAIYTPPRGSFMIAYDVDELIGCVALREQSALICEMKRLYVRPPGRGKGYGRELSLAAVARAREIGYERMRLDTLASMDTARSLYRSLGFVEISPYYNNPLPDVVYYELALTRR